jgi:hypothetical protein
MGVLRIAVPWRGERDLRVALAAFAALASADLAANPGPSLYASGVRYAREARTVSGGRREEWLVPSLVRARGRGDCEDLATWRAAELRRQGERGARAIAVPSGVGFHIVVRRADGRIEDPSKRLGM